MSIPADAVDAQFVLRRNLILLTKNPLTTPGLSFLSQPFRKLMFVYTYSHFFQVVASVIQKSF